MDLQELLIKEKDIESRKVLLNKKLYCLDRELNALYAAAMVEGFVWDSTEKKWYKDNDSN